MLDPHALTDALWQITAAAINPELLAAHPELEEQVKSAQLPAWQAVFSHIAANAEITVRVEPSTSGLQRDPASGDATLGPAETVVLKGTLA